MVDDIKDPPIEPQNFLGGVKVIDFGEARIRRGLSRRAPNECNHLKTMVYDMQERRIWCEGCETTVDPFDAFMLLVQQHDRAYKQVVEMQREVAEARKHSLHLIACKKLEKIWRGKKMTPSCPHCGEGILPEEMANISHMVSLELTKAKRKKT